MRTRVRRAGLFVVPAVGAAMLLAGLSPAGASSHKEAPLIATDPVADATDVYAFVSPDRAGSVTLVANYIPLENPASGPNFERFGDDVLYRINVDNNGDAVADIKFDFRFSTHVRSGDTFLYATGPVTSLDDPDLNIVQTYSVSRTERGKRTVMANGLVTPPDNVGPVSTPDYDDTAAKGVYSADGVKVFAGQRDDPFFVDLGSIFDLGQLRPFLPAYKPAPRDAEKGRNSISGFNLHSLVLQMPIEQLTSNHKPLAKGATDPHAVIGVWSTSYRQQLKVLTGNGKTFQAGKWVQISRLGNPLVNEVIIPLKDKDRFNASQPKDDAQFAKYVLDPLPAKIIHQLYGLNVPPAPRTSDLVPIYLTGIPGLNMPANVVPSEQLRLNMGVPASETENPLGVIGGDNAGFPNGRRLADDVVDISFRALAGGTPFTPEFNVSPNNDLGDGVNNGDKPFLGSFPYLGTPFSGYRDPHGMNKSASTIPLAP